MTRYLPGQCCDTDNNFAFEIIIFSDYLIHSYYQVLEFVGLTELYYAGSHGMDIMGPVRPSTIGHTNCIRSTDKQVIIIEIFL